MKKLQYITVLLFGFNLVSAQVAIGKSAVNGNSAILDFDSTSANSNGIILPAIADKNTALTATASNNNATFIFDKSDSKVKMYQNNAWVDLSDAAGDGTAVTSLTNSSAESGKGVVIGAATSNAVGVLILESTNKALILPQINNPATTVKSPFPGMMCYDTASLSLAVYDGVRWNYWK